MNTAILNIDEKPAVGNVWTWLNTAADNVNNVLAKADPIINKATGIINPPKNVETAVPVYVPQQTPPAQSTQTQATNNNTAMFIGLAGLGLLAIVLLKKK